MHKAFVVIRRMPLALTHFVHMLHGLHTARFVGSILLQRVFWHAKMLLRQSLLLAANVCELPPFPDVVAKTNKTLH